jgi:PAS domain S-box-containing protein
MGELIRKFDWAKTPVGPINSWPQSLRTAVSIIINSSFPMFIWWGENDLTNIYNDAYMAVLGEKHPNALGVSGKITWLEIWDDIGSLAHQVFSTGQPVYKKDLPLTINRYGREEDTFFTFSYSSIRDESGTISGLYCACVETTDQITASRELREGEERFRLMAEESQILIGVTDKNSAATYFNQAWTDITGRPVELLLEQGWADLIHPDDIESFGKHYFEALKLEQPFSGEIRIKSKDGSYRWIAARAAVRLTADGLFAGYISSSFDITDMKHAHEDQQRLKVVTEERNALVTLNKAKDEFIAIASHQLRTPATAVKQYISLLLEDFAGPLSDTQRQYLQTAHDSNERQLNIVNDLLKTAQIDADTYKLNQVYQDIVGVVRGAIEELEAMFQLREQTIVLQAPSDEIMVKIDVVEIKLVLVNLLENASKYSYASTKIIVSMKKTDARVWIAISDHGVGIASPDFGRIFDKFTRVDNALSDTVQGTGLGLYWSKRIIKLHHGTITVSSVVGVGSTFVIKLPLPGIPGI